MPPLGAPKPPGGAGGGGKPINLGVPSGAGPGPLPMALGTAPPMGGGGEGPQAPEMGGPPGGGDGGAGAQPGMDYPELNIAGLDDGSGLEDLPDEGHARIHYKVTSKGKHKGKSGKDKGKDKHHATLEVHHIQPEESGSKPSEADEIRNKAKKFFESEDQGPPGGPDQGPTSEMPG